MNQISRRGFLVGAAGAGLIVAAGPLTAPATAATRAERTRVYVLVVDGCSPREITATLMPNLAALRDTGTNYPAAQSLAGDGDDPQPRHDDDRRATGPIRRAGQLGVRPGLTGVSGRWTGRPTCAPHAAGAPAGARLQHRDVLSKEYLFGHLRHPGDLPLGTGADRAGQRHAPTSSRPTR
jgi:hypothetical protein